MLGLPSPFPPSRRHGAGRSIFLAALLGERAETGVIVLRHEHHRHTIMYASYEWVCLFHDHCSGQSFFRPQRAITTSRSPSRGSIRTIGI